MTTGKGILGSLAALAALYVVATVDVGSFLLWGAILGSVVAMSSAVFFLLSGDSVSDIVIDARPEPRVYSIEHLRGLSPSGFEVKVAKMLRRAGFTHVRVSGGAGDLQADISGVSPSGHATIVQCKRYSANTKVTSGDIQSFLGMVFLHHGACVGMYVTTGYFTQPARNLARQHNIVLIDAQGIVDGVEDELRAANLMTPPAHV